MNADSLIFALIVEYASSDTDEQHRQGYWDAIVHAAQLLHGISEEAATQRVHIQYAQICGADLV